MTARAREPAAPEAEAALDQSRLTHLVGYAASRAAIRLRRVFADHFAPLDLKVVDFSILMLVAANPKVNQKQLGEALDLSAPNMAVTLDRLVERGWVDRVRSTADRRSMHIHLTKLGALTVARAEKIAATMENPALHSLTAAERALLIELLMKVGGGPAAPRR
ncbi:MAG TPA: MarR family transcriptional regulator [Burkholderiaceae bacterium]|nr:MarR family transcriptional regulator [Burkholderiaceae bacterium]